MTFKPTCKPLRRRAAKSLFRGCSSMVEQQLPKRALLAQFRHLFANQRGSGGNPGSGLAMGCKL